MSRMGNNSVQVEGLMKKLIMPFILSIIVGNLFLFSAYSKNKKKDDSSVTIFYYNNIFGHVHQSSLRFSNSLTTLTCGHPVKVIESRSSELGRSTKAGWNKVVVGPYNGYIYSAFLSIQKPICFQDLYPKFFELFEVDLSDIYYWGRLYDQYLIGKSKVQ